LSQSASTEANAVATVVESLALSRPEVGFFLRSDGRRSLALPAAADLRERISQLHGLSLARSLVALEDPVVWGFVSPLAISFPTRRYLHVAVNGRVVAADSFAPAVAKAYADLLPKGRHPAAFLRLELGPGEVDVNVHPAKSAVRLRGGRSAYPLVVGTIRWALAQEREARATEWLHRVVRRHCIESRRSHPSGERQNPLLRRAVLSGRCFYDPSTPSLCCLCLGVRDAHQGATSRGQL